MKTVLVVEDETMVLDVTSELLELLGFRVLAAADGATALAHSRAATIDLILLDKSLPDIDGTELVPSLRSQQPNSVILICSGELTADQAPSSIPGVNGVLAKPFSLEKLQAVLRRYDL